MQRSTRKYTRKKISISHIGDSGHAPYVDARRRGLTYRLGYLLLLFVLPYLSFSAITKNSYLFGTFSRVLQLRCCQSPSHQRQGP